MNNKNENSKALHEPDLALDEYINNLVNDTEPLVKEAIKPVPAVSEGNPISANGGVELEQESIAAQPSSQVESHVLESLEEGKSKNHVRCHVIQKTEKEPEVDRDPLSVEVIDHQDQKPTDPQTVVKEQDLIITPTADVDLCSYLKFQVAGLNLAIDQNQVCWVHPWPTNTPQVRSVYPWPTETSMQASESEWLLGETYLGEHKVKIIDTAMLVIPKSRQAILLSAFRPRLNHVLTVENSDWGLACDKVLGKLKLQSADIQWRSEQGKRPWLAGTIVSQKCALLDVGAIVHYLEHGSWGDEEICLDAGKVAQ